MESARRSYRLTMEQEVLKRQQILSFASSSAWIATALPPLHRKKAHRKTSTCRLTSSCEALSGPVTVRAGVGLLLLIVFLSLRRVYSINTMRPFVLIYGIDKQGQNGRITAVWPGSSLHYREVLAQDRWEDWEWTYPGGRFKSWGRGISVVEQREGDYSYYMEHGPFLT